MHETGHTSTQDLFLTSTHGSAITYVIAILLYGQPDSGQLTPSRSYSITRVAAPRTHAGSALLSRRELQQVKRCKTCTNHASAIPQPGSFDSQPLGGPFQRPLESSLTQRPHEQLAGLGDAAAHYHDRWIHKIGHRGDRVTQPPPRL